MNQNTSATDLLAEKRTAKPEAELPSKDCAHCGVTFFRRTSKNGYRQKIDNWRKQIHCSRACADAARTLPEKMRTCETCRSAFTRPRTPNGRLQATHQWKKRRYCSLSCAAKGRSGEKISRPKKAASVRQRKPVTAKATDATKNFKPDARLPDPTPHKTLSHSPKDESNTKRIPSLLEQERASGVEHKPVSEAELKRSLGRALRLSPEFAEAFGIVFV